MPPPKPILVAVCGNPLAGNDAFGPLVAAFLQTKPLPNAEVINLESNPTLLLDALPSRRALLLVDAATSPHFPPGKLLDLNWFPPPQSPLLTPSTLSTHALSLDQQLRLAQVMHQLPPIVRLLALIIPPTSAPHSPPSLLFSRVPLAATQLRRHIRQLTLSSRPS